MTQTATTEAELLVQSADDYMNDAQQQFFRELLAQRAELQARIEEEFTELRQPEISSDVASTGEPIGLKRLLLRLTATLCIEAKERQEQREKHQRDRD
ncbi:TraR/DksA C4-type zinc finger protein [Pseudomonas sp. GD03721]|nr:MULTISPECIES: TraR/DksA C4-type zinc finger protein [unclassified Pseudomonas]MDH1441725.1 TraR/DksA C4-type zinc finger protein [Pseudomonas sp. GD03722]WGG01747.1 TraR/DksA C4-type zinc finger protein [Pseudomonas sp. GD03721]WGG05915.1 TraR/DksA C4-type zinc finger protein [Pseudomonas sp. GD03919]